MGFNFAARFAGIYPKINPIPTDTLKEMITATGVGVAVMPIRFPATWVTMAPRIMPIMPPMELVTAASITNCCMIVPLFAPKDFRIPISLVRSVTDTSMMFITPTPATRREIPAIPPSIPDIMAICSFKESRSSLFAVTS